MSDRVKANTLFFFVVGYAILPLCLVRNLLVENFYRWRHDNYQ